MGYWPIVKRVVKDSDIILFILDVRMPELSRNSTLERMFRLHNKKFVLVFTKIDLVTGKYLESVRRRYENAVFVSGIKNIGISKLKEKLMIMAKRSGIDEPRIGVVGYPNIGKSAIINALAKRAKAVVSKKAGTTRGIQWIRAGGLFVLDSPGVVPSMDKEFRLGILGSKNPEKLKNLEAVALEIIRIFVKYDKSILEEAYGVEIKGEDVNEIFDDIGVRKGFLLKGGVPDLNRAALLILRDWQKGKIKL